MKATTSETGVIARITHQLAKELGPRPFNMWFNGATQLEFKQHDAELVVRVANDLAAERIRRQFHDALQRAVRDQTGTHATVRVVADPEAFAHQRRQDPTVRDTPAHDPSSAVRSQPRRSTTVSLRHNLDSFVVGHSNRLAYTMATQLVDRQEEAPNRAVFLHGGCGLGKTHLLQGLCKHVMSARPDVRVHYTTGEQFTNEFLDAVRHNRMDSFRTRIRSLDLLAVDDVHFIANKPGTQQEFLHSFDAIGASGAKVALASDSHPKLIREFSERLVSLCLSGGVAQIHPPDQETRRRIVQTIVTRRGLSIQPAAVQPLLDLCHGSIREIEGKLNKLQALAQLETEPLNGSSTNTIGRALIERLIVLEHQAEGKPFKSVNFHDVLEQAAKVVGVPVDKIRGKGRQKHVVLARRLAFYAARHTTGMSFPELSRALGRDNHSTALTSVHHIQKLIDAQTVVDVPAELEPVTVQELLDRIKRNLRS